MKNHRMEELKHVHILGVCGTLMGAFAALLKRQGIRVTGTDQNMYPPMSDVLNEAGVELFQGYSKENLAQISPDLVVIGNVIRRDNPEAQYVMEQDLPYTSLPEFMEKFFLPETRNLVVAGTHGKTTTSSLLAHVLFQNQEDPSYFIGGVSLGLPHAFHLSETQQKYFVLEGDEYDTAFWDKVPKFNHYLPNDVILTSIEFDHVDIYSDFEAVKKAFRGLMGRIRSGGRLIACTDYPAVREMLSLCSEEVITYGLEASIETRFVASQIQEGSSATEFDILENGQKIAHLTIPLSGAYNVLNAMAVWIECRELGLSHEAISDSLKTFQGVKRRQEVRAEVNGVTVIDDFAHHPTAVQATLSGLKKKYSGRRLIAVFEPRSATSRRNIFQTEYESAFLAADYSFIAEPFCADALSADERLSSERLVSGILQKGGQAQVMSNVDEGVEEISRFCSSGDVVAVLSNGGFDGFIPKFIQKLEG